MQGARMLQQGCVLELVVIAELGDGIVAQGARGRLTRLCRASALLRDLSIVVIQSCFVTIRHQHCVRRTLKQSGGEFVRIIFCNRVIRKLGKQVWGSGGMQQEICKRQKIFWIGCVERLTHVRMVPASTASPVRRVAGAVNACRTQRARALGSLRENAVS
eukprot:3423998-Amphidinium_carterae.2